MRNINWRHISTFVLLMAFASATLSCTTASSNEIYFGRTVPPQRDIFRYVTGDEPESLDPVVSSGQPEARIYMALFEGLVEYHPKTMLPIPALAETWEINNDYSEFTFHLRKNGRWSNGDPIDANDFAYSFRRALAKETASRSASFGYYIKYAQPFNQGNVFARDQQTGQFLLAKDFSDDAAPEPLSTKSLAGSGEYPQGHDKPATAAEPELHQSMHTPLRLTLPGDEKARTKLLDKNVKLKAAVSGKEFVPIKGEDIGVEAVDNYTVRISLAQSTPFFTGLLAHQLFRLVPRKVVEQYKDQWALPGHIVTCGPFKLKTWQPYDKLVLEKDPMYWDAASVRLEEIHFFPMSDNPSI